jgi:hypothetical protein
VVTRVAYARLNQHTLNGSRRTRLKMPWVSDQITKLEDAEFRAAHKAVAAPRSGEPVSGNELAKIARTLFRIRTDGRLDPRVSHWGNHRSTVPIPLMLLLDPTLMVDVTAISLNDFVKSYGVTPDQFIELCEKQYVIPKCP